MTKVCVVTTVHIANDTRVYFKEVRSLSKRYDVTYIATNTETIENEKINIIDYEKPSSRIKRIMSFWKVYKLCLRQDAAVYHLQDPELILTGLLLKIISRKKVIYDVHEDYPDYIIQKEYLSKWIRIPLSKTMKFSEWLAGIFFDYVITADHNVYNRFSNSKTEVIYNFPDLSVFKTREQKPEKEFDLIYPGTLSKHMVNSILDIVYEALKLKPDMKVLLISASKATSSITLEWIEKQMEKRNISKKNITLRGRVPYTEVSSFIEMSRIGFIPLPNTPKFRKNIPTKLFEYMYCGVPVVANDLPPTRFFVENQNVCELVNIEDIVSTAKTIVGLLNNEERRESMGIKGKQLVLDEYNWLKEEQKLFKVYKKVVGRI